MKSAAGTTMVKELPLHEISENTIGKISGINGAAKRSFDLLLAIQVAVFTLPLLLTIAFIVKLQDGGPILFKHTRCGKAGKPFKCMKFRTMKVDAEAALEKLLASDPEAQAEWEKTQKLKKDPRITPIGRFLRKASLDELPQLINIIKGDMSLIGPRPVTFKELDRYGHNLCYYVATRPGVTGLWQVNGRNELTYDERIEYDAKYVREWSFTLDLVILAKTVPAVLKSEGAC